MPEVTAGAFDRQLSESGYVLDLRPGQGQPGPGQRDNLARGLACARQGAEPCVLLLSRSRDAEFDAVAGLLGKVGIPVARINADQLTAVDLLIDPDRQAVRLDGRWLAPTVTWNRHFSPGAIDGTGSPVRDLFSHESWATVASQLADLSVASMGPRRVGLLEQQALARRHQIAVPRTVVTTDTTRAWEFLGVRRLVIKAVDQHFVEASPGRLSGVFPVIVTHQDPLPAFRPSIPVIAQEYVDHDSELRVYYVNGEVLAFDVRKQSPADLWLASDRVEVRQVDPASPVVSATRCLAAGLGLRFGALDFLLRDGSPVFLEVNPNGDWRWAEHKSATGQVTMAVARMLRRLHLGARDRLLPPGNRPAVAFSLLRFLSPGGPDLT
ncbi:MAG: ATP-grasp domain-containing protein [Trebonia sp.]